MINVTPGAQDERKNRPREDDFDEEECTSRISELEKALKKARGEMNKYKEKYARGVKEASLQEQEADADRAEWEDTERRYIRKIKIVTKEMESRKKYRGRNKLKAMDRDTYDNANKATIMNFLRFRILPHHKFLNKKWSNWTPEKKHSYSGLLAAELAKPDEIGAKEFYNDKIVPASNKYVIDWRAMVGTSMGKVYKGESI